MANLPNMKDLNVAGKRVLVRVDFNVPMADGRVTDESRIVAHLPTIEWLVQNNAKVILMSHLGRPDGKKNAKYTLKPVAERLSAHISQEVQFADDCIGSTAEQAVASLKDGQVLLLENLRFYAEEENNDQAFAKKLAKMADVYISDAFGTAHRAHASISSVPQYVQHCAFGNVMNKELEALTQVLETPEKPVLVIIGGAKISSKIDVVRNLLPKADMMMIGGAMANTFLAALGNKMGNSLYESEYLQQASRILADSAAMGCRLLLPSDVMIANKLEAGVDSKVAKVDEIPDGQMALDIGPSTVQLWQRMVHNAQTVLWNGPMGAAEISPFHEGTEAIARAVGESKAYSVAGGGDTLAALAKTNMTREISYVSTGGGALMEFLEGKPLPGIAAITKKANAA